ncbi:MAG: hypothetical protein ACREAR_02995 [Nitrosotalea sp.]
MLSKTERKFVQDPSLFSKRDARQYRYMIKKRLERDLIDLQLIIKNNIILGLDMKKLETQLEQISSLIGSNCSKNPEKPSAYTQTSYNPLSAMNSDWG